MKQHEFNEDNCHITYLQQETYTLKITTTSDGKVISETIEDSGQIVFEDDN